MVVLSSHEDSEAWSIIYKFIHGLGNHFQFRMGDGAKETAKADEQVSIYIFQTSETIFLEHSLFSHYQSQE